MLVTITHNCSGEEGEPYTIEVPANASLQEIWDIAVNGGEKTDEITSDCFMQEAIEGSIIFDDNNEAYAGHRVSINWEARK